MDVENRDTNMDDIVNPPTPPLDENSLNDLPGEPISPEVSDSDVYLNADDTFEPTSTTSQKDDAGENADTEPELAAEEAATTEDVTNPVLPNENNDEITTATEQEPKIENEDTGSQNDVMDVDDGNQQSDVEMKEPEPSEPETKPDEATGKETEESSTNILKDESMEEIHENVDNSDLNETSEVDSSMFNETCDADNSALNESSDQSGKNFDDSDSFQNDSLGNEKHRTEEVDMENVEAVRDTSDKGAEDPFDAVRNNTSSNDKTDGADNQNKDQDDMDVHNENEKDDGNESNDETNAGGENYANETTTAEGDDADDIEEGKGVDEELSLLPDAEREISDADKERALQAEEDAAKESTKPNENDQDQAVEVNVNDNDDDANKDGSELPHDDVEITENADAAHAKENLELLAAALKEGEIKEIQGDLFEQTCLECGKVRDCKYTLIDHNSTKFLCEIDCVTAFRGKTDVTYTLSVKKVSILQIADSEQKCVQCSTAKPCKYRMRTTDKGFEYLCGDDCVTSFIGANVEKYIVKKKRYTIEEISETKDERKCVQCVDNKCCQFRFKQDDDEMFICNENCVNLMMKEQPDRFRLKRRSVRVRDLPKRAGIGSATINSSEPIQEQHKIVARTELESEAARLDRDASFVRRCSQCFATVIPNDRSLLWETLDFCNEVCLGQYQNIIGSACTTCHNTVSMTSLGKYCVRFGYEIRQFCQSSCLDEFKKGLKVCSYCQKDISKGPDGFLASIGGQFKDFCSQLCMKKYDDMCNPKKKANQGTCSVCNNLDQVRVEVLIDGHDHGFCSNPCFSAFKFVNNILTDKCAMCSKFFERKSNDAHTIYQDKTKICSMFCSKVCMNIFIITKRQIVPCQWCKVKKYNFDMIEKYSGNNKVMLCSLNCLTLCEVSMNAISMKKLLCDQCGSLVTPQYHLTMSDTSVRNFCTYQCVMSFQSQFQSAPLTLEDKVTGVNSPVPAGLPKRIKAVPPKPAPPPPVTYPKQKNNAKSRKNTTTAATKVPIIANVTSLATGLTTRNKRGQPAISITQLQPVVEIEPLPSNVLNKNLNTYQSSSKRNNISYDPPAPPAPPRVEVNTQIITVPPLPTKVSNMSTMCKPAVANKEILCKPTTVTIGCQTESHLEKKYIVPIPVPIYVPMPMHMYSLPVVTPVPIPLPIPVPVYIPTTRNSANGIMKEIKKIQDKMPTDPFEAELLMMAEMVAGDKKKEETESESEDDDDYGGEGITESNALGEDMLQMALKMASEYEEPAVDLESAMTANTITPSSHPHLSYDGVDDPIQHHHMLLLEQQRQMQGGQRGRKRGPVAQNRNSRTQASPPSKRSRRQEMPVMIPAPEPPREPVEKADANMCLKFTFGVNAWKQWVMTKNADLEKSSIRRKPFKSELLQLTADELNYSLCLFVKEVRKPNGSEYAPDTIYYLVLGIQQYLYENCRIDNIFTDPYYEKFTDCLDDVAKKFSVLYNDSQYIVTRVEEEHLWECKQLGAHSPHVLLSTLMFFNTKHFNLTTVEEHMQLSFSHIMKHWKRNPNQVGASKLPGSRNVLLRFYPPQSSLDNNSRKKKVYEQQENEENPLKCPVKLYEFYLSKCPESVKTRNDVFYLQPERSCVPDSPVWYSTQALGKESLCKMLHRVKMVKEINIALLTS
ncbi:Zinc finger MYM-type protein 3 [Pseudolycoriella hygida]|uniref:Zinc finger MYM-type protein 3 n=1 Tax=Pseudolycoriella hygida TaxID=35572 RepID=A0A9Q0MR55_9DIPT|nr:Zinc finger MYM-type protein 3 [Pseudolycoriella hygida]